MSVKVINPDSALICETESETWRNLYIHTHMHTSEHILLVRPYGAFQSQCYITKFKTAESQTHNNDNLRRRQMSIFHGRLFSSNKKILHILLFSSCM